MSTKKDISNPFSTGGGGHNFETRVQASFLALMLARGYAPCLNALPIQKIKLQGRHADFNTDDFIVFAGDPNSLEKKMLAQIKHKIAITENDPIFAEVINAAWEDYNNEELFNVGRDVLALITGPLSSADTNDVRTLLDWARHAEDSNDFFNKVNLAKFSSENKRKKLQAFRKNLDNANGDRPISDEKLFDFLKHFHLLGYDLDIKSGVTLSLVQSMIGIYSSNDVLGIWSRLIVEVEDVNQNAGTITLQSIPDDLQAIFKDPPHLVIPKEFLAKEPEQTVHNWEQDKNAADLAIATLIGGWDEGNENDVSLIKEIISDDYRQWLNHLRDML
jgi:hypothetical protein